MRVLLLQLDGTALPNLACLRIAGHHRVLGDEVVFRYSVGGAAAQRTIWDGARFDLVYGSLLFEKTRPRAHTPPLVGFARWVVGAYDKRIEWDAWKAARYRPERLGEHGPVHQQGLFA